GRSTIRLYRDAMPATPQPSEGPDAPAVATAERVATVVRDRIVTGALPPGTPLRETALATELGVSRNTLREGLRLLVAQGLVAQLLLAFGAATDEAGFQAPWIERDRGIAQLLVEGRRAEAREAMRDYLDASEQAVLDLVRAAEQTPISRRPRPRSLREGQ